LPSWPAKYDSTIVGARPILAQKGNEKLLSRGFEVLDHEKRDGLGGFITIGGGKMSDFRLMAEETSNLACEKLGIKNSCRTALETLDGETLAPSPFRRPSSILEGFLKARPHLREAHAFSHLAFAFLRHLSHSHPKSAEFKSYYSV
jgi:glycerol-3-phosphate dehydrogenase